MRIGKANLKQANLFVLLSFVLVFSFAMLLDKGTGDVPLFIEKMNNVAANGILSGFASEPAREYPPLTAAMLLIPKFLATHFSLSDLAALKLSIFLIYLLSTAILLTLSKDVLVCLVFAAAFAVSTMRLGYLDVWCAPFLFIALYLLDQDRPALGLTTYALACLVKWQPIVLGPFVLLYAFRAQGLLQILALPLRKDVWRCLAAFAILLAVLLSFFGSTLLKSLEFALANSRIFLAPNGLNVPLLSGIVYRLFADPIGLPPSIRNGIDLRDHYWVYLTFRALFAFMYLVMLVGAIRAGNDRSKILLLAVGAFWSYAMLSTGVHENHLAVAVMAAIYLAMCDRKLWPIAAMTAAMFNFNLLLFYVPTTFIDITDVPYAIGAIVSILGYLWVVAYCWYEFGEKTVSVGTSCWGSERQHG